MDPLFLAICMYIVYCIRFLRRAGVSLTPILRLAIIEFRSNLVCVLDSVDMLLHKYISNIVSLRRHSLLN